MRNITKVIKGLGTTNIISVKSDDDNVEKVLSDIEMLIQGYDRLWSIYSPDSLVTTLNKKGEVYTFSSKTIDIVRRAMQYSIDTDGYFDITTRPLNIIWKNAIKNKKMPAKADIDDARNSVDYRGISLSGNEIKLKKGQSIDLGGIAKGFLLDEIIIMLNDASITNATVNLGGAVGIIGRNEILIRNPFKPLKSRDMSYILSVDIEDKCVVTSGSYEQEYEKNGNRYHHIINPMTGYPADTNIKSITLIGDEGSKLDAYATGIFSMDISDVMKLLCKNNIEMIAILNDGCILATDSIKTNIKEVQYEKYNKR